jgi:hypothetical protein
VSVKEGAPAETLRAILKEMGDAVESSDIAELSRRLTIKAIEFKTLTERLNQLSSADPEVGRLRKAADLALSTGRFADADAALAAAEARDLEALKAFESKATERRLSAAESRAARAAASTLRSTADSYRLAAEHFAAAAELVSTDAPQVARGYAFERARVLYQLAARFADGSARESMVDAFKIAASGVVKADEPLEWGKSQVELAQAVALRAQMRYGGGLPPRAFKPDENGRLPDPSDYKSFLEEVRESLTIAEAGLEQITETRSREEWLRALLAKADILTQLSHVLDDVGLGNEASAVDQRAIETLMIAVGTTSFESDPELWMDAQDTLASKLLKIGLSQKDDSKIRAAVEIRPKVVSLSPRATKPIDWATAISNLASALEAEAQSRKDIASFQKRERHPTS